MFYLFIRYYLESLVLGENIASRPAQARAEVSVSDLGKERYGSSSRLTRKLDKELRSRRTTSKEVKSSSYRYRYECSKAGRKISCKKTKQIYMIATEGMKLCTYIGKILVLLEGLCRSADSRRPR